MTRFTVDGEPAPTCPHCKRVVNDEDGRISPHTTAPGRDAPVCPMSGKSDHFLLWE